MTKLLQTNGKHRDRDLAFVRDQCLSLAIRLFQNLPANTYMSTSWAIRGVAAAQRASALASSTLLMKPPPRPPAIEVPVSEGGNNHF